MILFGTLAIVALLMLIIAVVTLSIGGSFFIIIFADLFVCIAILVVIMKWLRSRKKK